jgi:hypothetical protein
MVRVNFGRLALSWDRSEGQDPMGVRREPSCGLQGDRLLKKKKELFPGYEDIQPVQEIEFLAKE